jgi:membrane associated rhomboid family serine protease
MRIQEVSYGAPRPRAGWPVWKILIAANVLCFVIQVFAGLYLNVPVEELFALSRSAVVRGFVWQFVTYMFLHGGVVHLLLNMVTLFFAGKIVEGNLGPGFLLKAYFIGGVVGGIAQFVSVWLVGGAVVGASAGVCAVLFSFTTLFPEARLTALLFFVVPVRMKARTLAIGFVAVSLFFILTRTGGNVGHLAHLGGCLVGWWMTRRQMAGGIPLGVPLFRGMRGHRRPGGGGHPFVSPSVDAILDKISAEGLHSLTPEERRILERGRNEIERRTRS